MRLAIALGAFLVLGCFDKSTDSTEPEVVDMPTAPPDPEAKERIWFPNPTTITSIVQGLDSSTSGHLFNYVAIEWQPVEGAIGYALYYRPDGSDTAFANIAYAETPGRLIGAGRYGVLFFKEGLFYLKVASIHFDGEMGEFSIPRAFYYSGK